MKSRLQILKETIKKHQLDAFLVTNDTNISYLTRFPSSESWLLVTPKHTWYITDFRYVLEAEKALKNGVQVKRYTRSVFITLNELFKRHAVRRLGYDGRHMTVHFYQMLKRGCAGIQFVEKQNWIEEQRSVKEGEEIDQIRACLRLNLDAYDYLKPRIKPGKSEQEMLILLDRYVKSRGARFSFDPIIAAGPNSCFPHAKVTSRKIKKNDVVLVDMGIDIDGYKSDLTRMFFLGRIPAFMRQVDEFVAVAQKNAIKSIRPGVKASEVDFQARNFLKKKKLDQYFGHSLGHGVGLDIHEYPRISQNSEIFLEPGMVFTVEPAVYIPNQFGIRIEDMVLVTKTGCEILSR